MKLPKPQSPAFFAEMINAQMVNRGVEILTGINEIHKVVSGDLSTVQIINFSIEDQMLKGFNVSNRVVSPFM